MSKFLLFGNNHLSDANFSSWEAGASSNFSVSQSYDQALLGLLNVLSNSGITMYQGDVSNLSSGFEEISIDSNNAQTIKKRKCSN